MMIKWLALLMLPMPVMAQGITISLSRLGLAVIYLLVAALLFWGLWEIIKACGPSGMFAKPIRIIMTIAAVVVVISIVLWAFGIGVPFLHVTS